MAALAKMQSDEEIQNKNEGKELKYEYKTNVNTMIGKLKDRLILTMIEKSLLKRTRMYRDLIREISKNTIPIRPDRQNPRKFKHYRDRYPMNARRGL